MSRIPPATNEMVPQEVRDMMAEEIRRYGAPLNTTQVWARHPGLLLAYRQFSDAMRATTLIPPALRYLVYVRVASLNGCPF